MRKCISNAEAFYPNIIICTSRRSFRDLKMSQIKLISKAFYKSNLISNNSNKCRSSSKHSISTISRKETWYIQIVSFRWNNVYQRYLLQMLMKKFEPSIINFHNFNVLSNIFINSFQDWSFLLLYPRYIKTLKFPSAAESPSIKKKTYEPVLPPTRLFLEVSFK